MPIFGNTSDVYAVVHLVPQARHRITVDRICYYCLLAANHVAYVHGIFLIQNMESFYLYWRKNYNDPLRSVFVANFLNVLRTYETPGTMDTAYFLG
jgi:hypothetical protein